MNIILKMFCSNEIDGLKHQVYNTWHSIKRTHMNPSILLPPEKINIHLNAIPVQLFHNANYLHRKIVSIVQIHVQHQQTVKKSSCTLKNIRLLDILLKAVQEESGLHQSNLLAYLFIILKFIVYQNGKSMQTYTT